MSGGRARSGNPTHRPAVAGERPRQLDSTLNALTTLSLLAATLATSAPYPLDSTTREVSTQGKLHCDRSALVRYAGDTVPYHSKVTVHPAFRERLQRLETLIASVATEIYGRAPRRTVHLGTFNCRRIRGYPHLMSEHALGNAIDIAGFDFGPLPRGAEAPDGLKRRHRRGFKVRMKRHWNASGHNARHARFLRTLAKRVIAADIFRVLLGPAWPGHDNHFHFDMAPYGTVAIFED